MADIEGVIYPEPPIVPGDGTGPDVDPETGDEAETFEPEEAT